MRDFRSLALSPDKFPFLALLLIVITRPALGADERSGEQIYKDLCAVCHGAAGEGTKDNYPKPLAGNRTLADLAKVIDDTMPADEPEQCSTDESRKVAAYIFEAFYSPMAQARLRSSQSCTEPISIQPVGTLLPYPVRTPTLTPSTNASNSELSFTTSAT